VILADVNVLIGAFHGNSSLHGVCKPWLDSIVLGNAQFGLSPVALAEVVGISTNPRIFREPG
jgi:predicted nucleic acid-binding protein